MMTKVVTRLIDLKSQIIYIGKQGKNNEGVTKNVLRNKQIRTERRGTKLSNVGDFNMNHTVLQLSW